MKKQKNQLDIWIISQISAFTGASIGSTQDQVVVWYLGDSKTHYELYLDFSKKELGFVDWVGDDKTYYSLVGVALSGGYTVEDYFTS